MKQISSPFQFFADRSGLPLDAGYIYIGAANQNPETSPITVYWDKAGTQPAAQPLRTSAGYIVNGTTRARLFIPEATTGYSVTVKSKTGALIDSLPDASVDAPVSSDGIANGAVTTAKIADAAVTKAKLSAALQTKLNESISFFDFGAVGNGVTDDTTAVQAALTEHLSTGVPLICGEGTFLVSAQIAIDVSSSLRTTGVSIHGAGRRRTIIKSTYTGGIPFFVKSTGGAFYHTIENIGFEGVNNSGPVLQIGKDDYSDAFNSCKFLGINVNNSSISASCEGARLNFILQSEIDIVSNCGGSGNPAYPATAPGYGSAIVTRQVQFCDLRLACGNANVGWKITGGYTYGNSITSLDIEEVQYGFRCDTANSSKNTITGGAIVASYCIDATAGVANVFIGTVMSAYAGGSIINGTNNTGVTLVQPGFSQAVNQLQLIDSTPGSSAVLAARGPDTNIRADVQAKGTGDVGVTSSDGRTHWVYAGNVASAVNFFSSANAVTGGRPALQANGSDTNIGMKFAHKGTASMEFSGQTTATSATGGAATALPAQPLGYLTVVINGTTAKIPYYAA